VGTIRRTLGRRTLVTFQWRSPNPPVLPKVRPVRPDRAAGPTHEQQFRS